MPIEYLPDKTPLHRYFDVNGAIMTLLNQNLRFNKVTNFNDPFEFAFRLQPVQTREDYVAFNRNVLDKARERGTVNGEPFSITDDEYNQRIKAIENITDEELKAFSHPDKYQYNEEITRPLNEGLMVCCFTIVETEQRNPLQWAHYAQQHKGIRLTFAFPENKVIRRVKYEENMVTVPPEDSTDDAAIGKYIEESMTTKSREWSYEQEARCIMGINDIPSGYANFDTEFLTEITFGVKTDPMVKQGIINLAKAKYPNAKLYQAKKSKVSYQIEYEPIT